MVWRPDDFRFGKPDRFSRQLTLPGSIYWIKCRLIETENDLLHVEREMIKYDYDDAKPRIMLEGINRYLHARKTSIEKDYNMKVRRCN